MSSIRLSPYKGGWGVKVEVGGVEMTDVRDIRLWCPVDGVPVLALEQYVDKDFDVALDGKVEVTAHLIDETHELLVDTRTDGLTRYRAVPKGMSFVHRCSGCGLHWHAIEAGSVAAELCGDCWRKVQPILHGGRDA